jgi:hypothetical protein
MYTAKNLSTSMTGQPNIEKDKLQASTNTKLNQETENEKILCPHCQRTATNGIKCKGICVADNDY